jgi:acetyl-CoA acetyltransferase
MRKVAVVGIGSTRFGKLGSAGVTGLGAWAVRDALMDSSLAAREIEVAYCGYSLTGLISGQECGAGQLALRDVGVTGIPITRVENACSSGSCAFREAWMAVASGAYDVALALGMEKMTGCDTGRAMEVLSCASDTELESSQGLTFPGVFGMIARRHAYEFGTTREQMAAVAIKNHRYGASNPKAHFQMEITLEDVLGSRMVADPLRLFDCCPMSDGAAAAILVSADRLRSLSSARPVWVASSAQTSGSYDARTAITGFDLTVRAAKQAYDRAGVGPEDIDLAEVHDCFTIAEIIHCEDLGFCQKGDGGRLVESGATGLNGRIPVNVSGGLKAKGHPVGATGLGQIAEIVSQLRGTAGNRQIPGARTALAHCMGGFFHADAASVVIHVLTI